MNAHAIENRQAAAMVLAASFRRHSGILPLNLTLNLYKTLNTGRRRLLTVAHDRGSSEVNRFFSCPSGEMSRIHVEMEACWTI